MRVDNRLYFPATYNIIHTTAHLLVRNFATEVAWRHFVGRELLFRLSSSSSFYFESGNMAHTQTLKDGQTDIQTE